MLQGQDTDRGAQAQPRGFPCQRGEKELWTGTDPQRVEMLLANPDRVKSQLFSVDHEVEGVLVVGQLVLALREKVEQCHQTALHKSASFLAPGRTRQPTTHHYGGPGVIGWVVSCDNLSPPRP